MKKKITYEQPLNERMRNLLRLEHLFEGITYNVKGPATWDSRAVISHLVEILDFLGRFDLKTELVKDLEHHVQGLERWQATPHVDIERVNQLLNNLQHLCRELTTSNGQGNELLQHPLISAIRQRSTIPGGTCSFDLPGYHHWLQRNPKQRQNELNDWLSSLQPLREAIDLNLYMIRNNTVNSNETAESGFFQAKLDAEADYQLIRINLPIEHTCYPEISGGKHRVTIRFFEQIDFQERPVQTEQNVNFELCCCMI